MYKILIPLGYLNQCLLSIHILKHPKTDDTTQIYRRSQQFLDTTVRVQLLVRDCCTILGDGAGCDINTLDFEIPLHLGIKNE